MSKRDVMAIEEFDTAIEWQADHAAQNGAECTARVVRALSGVRESETELGRAMAAWEGLTLKDAMPLRVTGGLHHLVLTGLDERLRAVYSGELTDQSAIDALVLDIARQHDALLAPWLDGPPQTNEAGRSASIMAGLLWLSQRVRPQFELFELGASAGVNTMIDRYFYDLGGTRVGLEGSPMTIVPEWRGQGAAPAAPDDFAILSVKGCDVAPINLADPDSALRLKAYVWPDAPQRLERIDAAIQLASECAPDLVKMDAADFALSQLEKPQAAGTSRGMFHSIMWQYMPSATQDAITQGFEAAGARATPDRPLAWLSLETDPATFRHELKVRYWDGSPASGETHLLAHAHPHGAWVEWTGNTPLKL
ncbi:MAG: DUF2332 domain-containing protein [Pseudomonadota bacterium]